MLWGKALGSSGVGWSPLLLLAIATVGVAAVWWWQEQCACVSGNFQCYIRWESGNIPLASIKFDGNFGLISTLIFVIPFYPFHHSLDAWINHQLGLYLIITLMHKCSITWYIFVCLDFFHNGSLILSWQR
jgi:hypothetical protein